MRSLAACTDAWGRAEGSEGNPRIDGPSSFDKGAKAVQHMVLGPLDVTGKRLKFGPCVTPSTKMNSKWIKSKCESENV